MTEEQIESLQPALARFVEPFRGCFKRDKTFGYWQKYMSGLLSDLKRKSIEPIALAAGVPVRTLQEFVSTFVWDDSGATDVLQRRVAGRTGDRERIAVFEPSSHGKQGTQTPGVQRQWSGEDGKVENCVVGAHLLYTNNDGANPFNCMLGSDLYLPEKTWGADRERCKAAGIPDTVVYRPKWRIGVDLLKQALGNGVRLDWVTFDEEFGNVPEFWFELDRAGLRAVGEVKADFYCWATPPACQSLRAEHSAKRVDHLAVYSPVFRRQKWKRIKVKNTTRGPLVWRVKSTLVQLVAQRCDDHRHSVPTERRYWLIVAQNEHTGEVKYFVSNAPATMKAKTLLRIGFARWHVELWFERAKQEAGLGAFEVRNYRGLIRHWLSARVAMMFLAEQTCRLRKTKSRDHLRAGRVGRQSVDPGDRAARSPFAGESGQPVRLSSTPEQGVVRQPPPGRQEEGQILALSY